ncbi:MAG TPA: hypothetical protein VLQ45_25165 [Thermoanaerobaculia bacterium]|nr:hypothetical protein [Thermoanaerobaculia bacterium]
MSKPLRVFAALALLCALAALPAAARPLASAPEPVSVWEKISAPFAALWNVLAGPATSTKEDSDSRGGFDPWGGTADSQSLTDCRGGIDPWGACSSGD